VLALLAMSAALAGAPDPPVDPPLAPDAESVRLGRQARQLRTVGVTCALAGPPIIVAGWALAAAGAERDRSELTLGGVGLGAAGALATLTGVPLVLGGSAVGRHAAAREGRPRASVAVPVVAGALFVGSGTLVVAAGFDGPSWPIWTATGLYVGGLSLAWFDADRSVRGGAVAVAPWFGPRGTHGIVITGSLGR
jgi:hypothetical protein